MEGAVLKYGLLMAFPVVVLQTSSAAEDQTGLASEKVGIAINSLQV